KNEPKAISIRDITGKKISRKQLLSSFLDEFESKLLNINHENIIDQWKKYTSTIGKEVKIETPAGISCGIATDVDETGGLILKQENGTEKKIIYGDCFHKESE
ncbi:MAG: biotin--[acetyl-CoA-carboxylase] ligase, partial [Thermodesulfobacteriota bacterium]|nr:biotin--[acetyl-CoA-carboxylase] ligase [Thermodesulfobacteriota bacterium]